ncbi:hypothetical protein CRM75_09565 [Enterococcus faecium]|nr:hypothetical protein CRM75_09565 [Enterococcus faecium]
MIYKTNESIIIIQAEAIQPISTGVVFWSYDRGTAKLRFKLQKNGLPQSLPEGTMVPIRLIFKSTTAEGGYGKHDYLATIEDRLNGIVSIVLEDNILGYQGRVDGSIYIDFPNDQSLDTAGRFIFDIKRSPIDDSTPELEDYYFNGFSQTLDKIEQMITEAKADIEQTVTQTKTDINTVATQTKDDIDTAATNVETRIDEAKGELATLNNDMTSLEGKIAEADQHFITKESVEAGPLIYKDEYITTQDWNDAVGSGIYYCAAASGVNKPINSTLYGYLIVLHEVGVVTQLFTSGVVFYTRTLMGNPQTWSSWKEVATMDKVMNLTDPQSSHGLKNFIDGIQVDGKEVVTYPDMPLEAYFGSGTTLKDSSNNARLTVGNLIATDNFHGEDDVPFTWNSGKYEATMTRDAVLYINATIRLQGGNNNTTYSDYAYVKLEHGTTTGGSGESKEDFVMIGANSGQALNLSNSRTGQTIITLKAGEKFAFTIELRTDKKYSVGSL